MDDQVLVGVVDGGTDGAEELEPRDGGELVPVAVRVDREALDVVYDQVGEAVCSRAPVQEFDDVRVVEAGEDLPLGPEATEKRAGPHPRLDELDGYPLLVVVIGTHREVNRPHATLADGADDLIGADP